MSWFSKDKANCPEGSVHVWEYRGDYYKTKELRDKAESSYKYSLDRERFLDFAEGKVRLSTGAFAPIYNCYPSFIIRSCLSTLYDHIPDLRR